MIFGRTHGLTKPCKLMLWLIHPIIAGLRYQATNRSLAAEESYDHIPVYGKETKNTLLLLSDKLSLVDVFGLSKSFQQLFTKVFTQGYRDLPASPARWLRRWEPPSLHENRSTPMPCWEQPWRPWTLRNLGSTNPGSGASFSGIHQSHEYV